MAEKRRLNAWENKKFYEKQQQEHLRHKLEERIPSAAEKREAAKDSRIQKLREHFERVKQRR